MENELSNIKHNYKKLAETNEILKIQIEVSVIFRKQIFFKIFNLTMFIILLD